MAFNHKINCAFRRAHLLLVVSLLTFSVLPAYAKETTFTREELKPFNVPKVQDIPACKYVTRGLMIDTTGPKPELFTNVKSIYLLAERADNGLPDLKSIPFFEPENLATLAACTLQTRLATRKKGSATISSKPLYIPSRTIPLSDWPEIKEDGKLIVLVRAEILGHIFQESLHPKLALLHARYFRHDVHDVDSMLRQCTTAFPYTDDRDALQRLLTKAMRACLYQPYASVCKALKDCPKHKHGDAK